MEINNPVPSGPTASKPDRDVNAILKEKALALEANFLAEMLKSAGFGKARDAFGGGAGEDQFGSFLRQAQADELARSGGLGLAESIYKSLVERT
ncbi:rod-binding protein [Algirhabdus cladophorae]|uniref:rod-binding protein n=1 Tax=Algirhabdus cladophorae TaxID=3377108 RepID=UPI003B846D38